MRPETIALHSGFDCDPTTKSVAVPIYQTVAYAFDSAAHGAALFDLEVEQSRAMRGAVEGVGNRLVDGHGNGLGGRVAVEAAVQSDSLWSHCLASPVGLQPLPRPRLRITCADAIGTVCAL